MTPTLTSMMLPGLMEGLPTRPSAAGLVEAAEDEDEKTEAPAAQIPEAAAEQPATHRVVRSHSTRTPAPKHVSSNSL
jgi:hypothetical protein